MLAFRYDESHFNFASTITALEFVLIRNCLPSSGQGPISSSIWFPANPYQIHMGDRISAHMPLVAPILDILPL